MRRAVDGLWRVVKALATTASLLGLATCHGNDPRFLVPQAVGDPVQQAAPAAPLLPFDDAVVAATDALLASARLPDAEPSGRHLLVIDPLIDGVTGTRSAATASTESHIATIRFR